MYALRKFLAHWQAVIFNARHSGGWAVTQWTTDPNADSRYDAPATWRR